MGLKSELVYLQTWGEIKSCGLVFFSGLVPAAYPETSRTVLSPAGNAEDAREDESKSKQASQKVLFENKRFPPFQQ